MVWDPAFCSTAIHSCSQSLEGRESRKRWVITGLIKNDYFSLNKPIISSTEIPHNFKVVAVCEIACAILNRQN